jgi:hypothetical protein
MANAITNHVLTVSHSSAAFHTFYFFTDSKAKHPSGQRSKFEDPACSFFPPPIPVWRDALANVDTSETNFAFGKLASDSGYVVPEPALLVGAQATGKSNAMFQSWLVFRQICMLRLATRSSLAQPKHGNAWKALLTYAYSQQRATAEKAPGKKAQEREELRKTMFSFMSGALLDELDIQATADIPFDDSQAAWHRIRFSELQEAHFEQILWELHEINFRFELQALDRRARIGTPFEDDPNAESLLAACTPGRTFSTASLHVANHGLASLSFQERSHYLLAMGRVMRRWRWVSSNGWISKAEKVSWKAAEIDALEKEIASSYTQLFFNCFRRAPIVPHRLSETAVSNMPHFGFPHEPVYAPIVENTSNVVINEFLHSL